MKSKTKKILQRICSFICAIAMITANIATLITSTVKVIGAETGNTVWIVGNSTVSAFNGSPLLPRYGWGTQIAGYLDGTFDVQNLALSVEVL